MLLYFKRCLCVLCSELEVSDAENEIPSAPQEIEISTLPQSMY